MATFATWRRIVRWALVYGFSASLLSGQVFVAAAPVTTGAGYSYEIQQWIDEASHVQ
jgi:hypothetical protein